MKELIQTRREMRAKRDGAIRKNPIALVDVGSSRISAMIARFIPDEDESGVPSFRIIAAQQIASSGVRYGEITAMNFAESDFMRLMDALQRQAGTRVDHAYVCFSGGRPASFGASGEAKVVNGEVTEMNIGTAMMNCEFPELAPDREYLHALPVNFALDHRTGLHDPRGQIGGQLAVDMHLLSVDSNAVHNVSQLVRRAGMELIGVTSSAYMSGLAALTEDEQEIGSVVVDFGSQTTSVAVFLHKQLLYVRTLGLGGYHVTNDIAQALHIDFSQAERIKSMHGGVEATAADDRETIDISAEHFAQREYVTRAELIGIIRPRIEEIFEELDGIMKESGIQDMPSRRIVLTGGASQLPGLEGLAERYLGRGIRLGRPIRLPGAPTHQLGAGSSAISGLSMHAAAPKDELWDFSNVDSAASNMSLRKMLGWFRANW